MAGGNPPLALIHAKRTSFRLLSKVVPPRAQKFLSRAYTKATPWIGHWIGAIVLFLVFVDAIVNNWAINDFCGNGMQFRTPVAHAKATSDLRTIYSFADGLSLSNLSHIGLWMTTFSVDDLATNAQDIYLLTAGSYEIVGESMNLCGAFVGNYSIDISMPVKLATVNDAVTFLRGDAVSHAFTRDLTTNLPTKDSKMADLEALGFKGARIQVDLRMTTGIPVVNTTSTQTFISKWYRVYSKSYCTGCSPIAELGRGVCNITGVYQDSTRTFVVTTSRHVVNSIHDLGIMFRRDVYSTIASIMRYIAIFIAVAGYLASRKTVQWQEENLEKVETVWNKLVTMISPKYFPHLSHAIRFDIFCYNSDIFVVLFVLANVIDMNHAFVYIREVNVFNEKSPQFGMSLQLFALSTRLLWLNVGLAKLAKAAVHLVSPAVYCGESTVMPFFNFSSVTTLYLSAIMLFFVPDYIEYNNKSRWDIHNRFEPLDGHFVDFFHSFYFRGVPSVLIGLVTNVLCVLAFDHVVMFKLWHYLRKNSLSRQAIYNSTSIICEYIADFQTSVDGQTIIQCKARRLSTLQWYFMSHMMCFALPEKDMSKKKAAATAASTTGQAAAKSNEADTKDIMYVVGQSDNGHIHLFDDHLVDVKSLPFNIKVLRNTFVTIK